MFVKMQFKDTRIMVPITGRASLFLVFQKQNGGGGGETEQNNRSINLPKVKHSPQTTTTPPNPNLYYTQ